MDITKASVIVGVIDNGEICAVLNSRYGKTRIEIERIIDCEVNSGFHSYFEMRLYRKEYGILKHEASHHRARFNIVDSIALIDSRDFFEVEYVS